MLRVCWLAVAPDEDWADQGRRVSCTQPLWVVYFPCKRVLCPMAHSTKTFRPADLPDSGYWRQPASSKRHIFCVYFSGV
jgi:hypothetical protein